MICRGLLVFCWHRPLVARVYDVFLTGLLINGDVSIGLCDCIPMGCAWWFRSGADFGRGGGGVRGLGWVLRVRTCSSISCAYPMNVLLTCAVTTTLPFPVALDLPLPLQCVLHLLVEIPFAVYIVVMKVHVRSVRVLDTCRLIAPVDV